MEKRLILAIALSMLILIAFSNFMGKPSTPANIQTTQTVAPATSSVIIPKESSQIPDKNAEIEQNQPEIEFSNRKIKILFNETQASIKEAFFKDYQNHKFTLHKSFFIQEDNLEFKQGKLSSDMIEFVHSDVNKEIIKRFTYSNNNYELYLDIEVKNNASTTLKFNYPIIISIIDLASSQVQSKLQDIMVAEQDKIVRPNIKKDALFSRPLFIGMRDRYFCLVTEPENKNEEVFITKINNKESVLGMRFFESNIGPGETQSYKFHIYLGPQDLSIINKIDHRWVAIVNYGTFDFISQILLKLLRFIQGIVNNWGIAIILFSIVVYLILSPLMLKQLRSMKQMQSLQPEIEKLRQAHKDNPHKMNKELMELYRLNKVNPFGGCLPLILQIPIFFALYQALMRSVELKGATFLWIKDLSEPDRIATLPNSLPMIGNEINILPILMAIGMFFQQKMTMSTSSGEAAEQQKLMVIIFPIMFGVIFYHMPSGLVLYWFVNSGLTMLNQMRLMRAK